MNEGIAGIRNDLIQFFAWPAAFASVSQPLRNLAAVLNIDALIELATVAQINGEVIFTILSGSYLRTGLNWVAALHRLGIGNFIVIAGDGDAADALRQRHIRHLACHFAIDDASMNASAHIPAGFSVSGLAMTALKFPIARCLVAAGYSVVFSDADAVWLRDPMDELRAADIAFQRVAGHPLPIVRLWGFAACSGFISFRHHPSVMDFLDRCIHYHLVQQDDQVAFNIALLDHEPTWWTGSNDPQPSTRFSLDAVRSRFAENASLPISGELRGGAATLLALPHDRYWRHDFAPAPLENMLICHPNSPKDDLAKIEIFRNRGIYFPFTGTR